MCSLQRHCYHNFKWLLMQICSNVDLQRYPSKFCMITYELDIYVFVSLSFLVHLWFLYESDLRIFLIIRSNEYFSSQRNDVISNIFDKIKVSRVSLCVIFAWRSLEITLTVPLNKSKFSCDCCSVKITSSAITCI